MLYNRLSVFTVLAALTGFAKPLSSRWDEIRVKHSWDTVPENWESLGPPLAGTMINLRIALKPHRENALIDSLYEEQVADLVAPHPDTLEVVRSWLEHYGVPSSSFSMVHTGNWLKLTSVPVSQANELLSASYELYRHVETNETILRTIRYALPDALHAHVQTVTPTTYFASPHTLRETPRIRTGGAAAVGAPRDVTGREDDEDYVEPTYLRWLYNAETYVPKATDRNVIGVTGYHGEYPSRRDLRLFMKKYRNDGVDATYKLVPVNGGERDPRIPGEEAGLNVQYTQGITFPTPHVFYRIGGLPPSFKPDSNSKINENEPFLTWLEYVLDPLAPKIPQTISTSYSDTEQTVPPDYAMSVCRLFAQLGNRGVSALYSSGNVGVGSGDCKANDGSGKVQFLPRFPSSCPWVTSVGGTENDSPEIAASLSSGGFSNYFEVPDYQKSVVPTFIRNLEGQHDGYYNATSRGFPDIAAQARDFAMVFDGFIENVKGTSCATPVAASIISLLNDFLLYNDRPPLGFLNPFLYGKGQDGLNDITQGSNPACKTDGFSAVAGWDPVTGLGTLNFLKLQKVLIDLHGIPVDPPTTA